jgi:hypothetical protein
MPRLSSLSLLSESRAPLHRMKNGSIFFSSRKEKGAGIQSTPSGGVASSAHRHTHTQLRAFGKMAAMTQPSQGQQRGEREDSGKTIGPLEGRGGRYRPSLVTSRGPRRGDRRNAGRFLPTLCRRNIYDLWTNSR